MVTTTTEEYYYDDTVVPMTPGVQIPSAIGLSILILIGIVGNAMTICAYCFDTKLGSVYDFYILNLAITDLLLCCISMPFYAVYTLMEFTWPFGYAFCKIWLIMDFTLCFESILIMLLLSFDILLMMNFGPSYLFKFTKSIAAIVIGISWVISFLVYGPAIIGWNHWVGYSTVEEDDCDVEFVNDVPFTTATAFVEFVLPFVCLTSVNALIYYKIRKQVKQKAKAKTIRFGVSSNGKTCLKSFDDDASSKTKTDQNEPGQSSAPDKFNTNGENSQKEDNKQNETMEDKAKSQRHEKAAKFLGILVLAFLIFWAPYTVTTVVISFCEECVGTSLYEFFNWLLWMKSAVNPFLYAYNIPRYQKYFKKYLTLNGRICKGTKVSPEQNVTASSVY
ncbi:G-protein coupled receptor [Mactra antiquata]